MVMTFRDNLTRSALFAIGGILKHIGVGSGGQGGGGGGGVGMEQPSIILEVGGGGDNIPIAPLPQ